MKEEILDFKKEVVSIFKDTTKFTIISVVILLSWIVYQLVILYKIDWMWHLMFFDYSNVINDFLFIVGALFILYLIIWILASILIVITLLFRKTKYKILDIVEFILIIFWSVWIGVSFLFFYKWLFISVVFCVIYIYTYFILYYLLTKDHRKKITRRWFYIVFLPYVWLWYMLMLSLQPLF